VGGVTGLAPDHRFCGRGHRLPKCGEFSNLLSVAQMMLCSRSTDDGMTLLRTSGLQKGELLEVCLVLPLRHLLGLTHHCKIILREGDLPSKAFSIFMSRGKHHGILHLHSRYPLQCLPFYQSSLVLHILNTKGCAVPFRRGLPSSICSGDGFSRPSHLCLQCRNICAVLG
jgi:hypothetical protein